MGANKGARLAASVLLCGGLWALPARAETPEPPASGLRRAGGELKVLPVLEDYAGVLYGLRGMRYVTPTTYWGLLAFGTVPLVGRELAPSINTIGLLAGYEGRLPHRLSYDLNLHLGWTRNSSDCFESPLGNQASLEPSVAVGLPVPYFKGTRLSLALGYMVLPLALGSSVPTLALRVETKTRETSVAVDD